MYINDTIKNYLDDLAARKPAPGGGSAAALEGATGCALMSMVANYTVSNKKYAGFKNRASAVLDQSSRLRDKMMELVDKDVAAYTNLSDAFKRFSNDSPELQALYKSACNVPFDICRSADEGLNIAKELVVIGNTNLVTDTAIAALMLESAFFGGKFNAYINLKYIDDKKYVRSAHKILSGLEESVPKLKEFILHKAEGIITT